MVKQKIEIEIDVPEGYEWTGEFRKPKKGELILANWQFDRLRSYAHVPKYDYTDDSYPILRKAEVWVQLTPEKALEFMVAKKPVTLRHISWRSTGQTITREINSVYYDYPGARDLSIDLEIQAHIKNVEYLKESE